MSVNAGKTIFVSCAKEDEPFFEELKSMPLATKFPVKFTSMVEHASFAESVWEEKAHRHIREADGVLAVITKHSLHSASQKWEIRAAKTQKRPLQGIWAHHQDHVEFDNVPAEDGTAENISKFIDEL